MAVRLCCTHWRRFNSYTARRCALHIHFQHVRRPKGINQKLTDIHTAIKHCTSVRSPELAPKPSSGKGKTMTTTVQILVLMMLLSALPPDAMAKNSASEKATVYSDKYQGRKTASGQRYNKRSMTAASSTLPLGTKVIVRNKKNGRSTTVVINDRKSGRGSKLDLSKAAANKLGISGVAQVSTQVAKK
jgi:rare lipoprotein A